MIFLRGRNKLEQKALKTFEQISLFSRCVCIQRLSPKSGGTITREKKKEKGKATQKVASGEKREGKESYGHGHEKTKRGQQTRDPNHKKRKKNEKRERSCLITRRLTLSPLHKVIFFSIRLAKSNPERGPSHSHIHTLHSSVLTPLRLPTTNTPHRTTPRARCLP